MFIMPGIGDEKHKRMFLAFIFVALPGLLLSFTTVAGTLPGCGARFRLMPRAQLLRLWLTVRVTGVTWGLTFIAFGITFMSTNGACDNIDSGACGQGYSKLPPGAGTLPGHTGCTPTPCTFPRCILC